MAVVLEAFGPSLWIAGGPSITAVAGFHYPTRMAVIRLPSGDLFVWSPIPLSEALREAVEALGDVRHLVVPNSLHDSFAGEWRTAYPDATLHAAPRVREHRPDLAVDHELQDVPPAAWSNEIDQVIVRGNRITTEVVFFHKDSGTVLVTDLIQQFPPGWFRGWRALVARLDLMTEAEPSVPRKFRVAFADRPLARAAVRRILDWPADRVLMAHGQPVRAGGKAFLARAFRWLTG